MRNGLLKDYLHIFKIPFIVMVLFIVGTLIFWSLGKGSMGEYVRTNDSSPEERVFDYADVLTKEEEELLREQIHAAEKKIGCDIVIVILNESLEEYAMAYEDQTGPLDPSEYTMVYANTFYDENQFGFDEPLGDGVLLVDNWFRESDGNIYTWFSPSGRAWDHYTSSMIDSTVEAFIEAVEKSPVDGYRLFVEMVEAEMSPGLTGGFQLSWWMIALAAMVVSSIFFGINFGGRKGKKTVSANTYVSTGRPQMREKTDQFLTKTVTRRKIKTSSGSGGGGGGGARISRGGGGSR